MSKLFCSILLFILVDSRLFSEVLANDDRLTAVIYIPEQTSLLPLSHWRSETGPITVLGIKKTEITKQYNTIFFQIIGPSRELTTDKFIVGSFVPEIALVFSERKIFLMSLSCLSVVEYKRDSDNAKWDFSYASILPELSDRLKIFAFDVKADAFLSDTFKRQKQREKVDP